MSISLLLLGLPTLSAFAGMAGIGSDLNPLGLPTSKVSRVTKQETHRISAMRSFKGLQFAQPWAGIAAWLMCKDGPISGKVKKEKKATEKEIPGAERQVTRVGLPLAISREPLSVREESDRLILLQGEDTLGEFVFAGSAVKRPYFSNMRAPGGIPVTRTFPPVEGVDATDHADMHPGIWLGFGDINGEDFWRNKGTIRHDKFSKTPVLQDEPGMEGEALKFATSSTLLAKDGRAMGRLDSEFTVGNAKAVEKVNGGALLVLWKATFRATEGDLVFGDQEEMGFGVRVATAIAEKNGGVITNSNKLLGAKNTWGQPAAWCDYSGKIDGHSVGITIVPKPRQGQPTWWHNRDYGLFVANAFGRKAMKQGEKMSTTVLKGGALELAFAAILHSGDYALTQGEGAK